MGLIWEKERDYTALVAVRRLDRSSENKAPLFQVPAIRRFDLGTLYPDIVFHVREILSRPPFRGATLVIDKTGVGTAIADLFEVTGINPVKVTITGGDKVTIEGRDWHIPKNELISCVGASLHTDSLHIHPDLPLAETLQSELLDFHTKHTASGYMQHSAREGAHDDILLALSVALFHADNRADRSHFNWMEFLRRSGGHSISRPAEQKPRVTVRAPTNISMVYTLTGRALNVRANGTIEVEQDEATPLLQAGWRVAA